MVRQYDLSVVPAKAGTHTPRNLTRKTEPTPGTTITAGGYGSLLSQGRPAGVTARTTPTPAAPSPACGGGLGWGCVRNGSAEDKSERRDERAEHYRERARCFPPPPFASRRHPPPQAGEGRITPTPLSRRRRRRWSGRS